MTDGIPPLVMGGRFRVLSHLGGGGMSEVYLGEQVSLGRKVALKVLKRDLGKRPEMAERFRREARLLSSVDHPAVVRVIDFESSPAATILVLELAEGETLEQLHKREGALAPPRAMALLAQLAEGLSAIHEKGIVHRDIKPQNVVVTPSPRGELARLLDFGIARLMELPDEPGPALGGINLRISGLNPMLSHPGQVVGTPAYVAPEQATGGVLDARTDVYAFGVLAYRLLSAQFPFPGPGSKEFLQQHVEAPPKPLVEAAPALEKSPELVALVMQCLAKKPADRPADGKALAAALWTMVAANPMESAITTPTRRMLSSPSGSTPVPPPKPSVLDGVLATAGAVSNKSVQGAKATLAAAQGLSPQWRRAVGLTALAALLVPAAWAAWPPTVAQQAAHLIETGAAEQALEQLELRELAAPGEVPELSALEVAALHRLNRHDEERERLRSRPYQTLYAAHPLLLEALAEDMGAREDDEELRNLMGLLPPEVLDPPFRLLAKGPRSRRQWGALRYLDRSDRAGNLDRVELYGRALNDDDCRIRARAASRLGELGDADAIDALRTLSERPKDEQRGEKLNCGQDEAAEAIRQLRRGKH
ncbi:MAG: serine/threonine protein kinase [Myxococcaceae bacterium]|nr:serine/threonine protein kinase [Myxococcaceae bacterium]